MNIVYVSCLCSKKTYNKLFDNSKVKPGQQVQKYHRLMAEGLAKNDNINVKTISAPPITRQTNCKWYIRIKDEIENEVQYSYIPIINIPVVKNILIFFSSFYYTLKNILANKSKMVVCDILNISVTSGALLASKILGVMSVGIITDIPILLAGGKKSIGVTINNCIMNKFDSYVFMTEEMNRLVNTKNKPYSVVEGLVDINMKETISNLEDKYDKKVCIYAGGLQKIYGIKYLCEAFILAKVENAELHIYGSGDFEEELTELVKVNNNIKYFGVKDNDFVVREQLKSTLLINPRPTNEEYTKYSFPSKNMEYMVSGTPILTTKLPGMPKDYYKYIYLINNESTEGLAKVLSELLNKSNEELFERGSIAKKFVLANKNNIIQAKKIIHLVGKE